MTAPYWWRGATPAQPDACVPFMVRTAKGISLAMLCRELGYKVPSFGTSDAQMRAMLLSPAQTGHSAFQRDFIDVFAAFGVAMVGIDLATGADFTVSAWA